MPTRISDENESSSYFLSKQAADIQYVNQAGDAMQGDLDINDKKITNLKYPTDIGDAASKLYVDLNPARVTSPFRIISLHIKRIIPTSRVLLVTEELEAPGISNVSQVFVMAYDLRIFEDKGIKVYIIGTLGTANTKIKIKFALEETDTRDDKGNKLLATHLISFDVLILILPAVPPAPQLTMETEMCE